MCLFVRRSYNIVDLLEKKVMKRIGCVSHQLRRIRSWISRRAGITITNNHTKYGIVIFRTRYYAHYYKHCVVHLRFNNPTILYTYTSISTTYIYVWLCIMCRYFVCTYFNFLFVIWDTKVKYKFIIIYIGGAVLFLLLILNPGIAVIFIVTKDMDIKLNKFYIPMIC